MFIINVILTSVHYNILNVLMLLVPLNDNTFLRLNAFGEL